VEGFYNIMEKGGYLMWPIVACSVIALGVFIERMVALRSEKVIPRNLLDKVRSLVSGGKITDAATLCEGNESPLAAVLAAGLKTSNRPIRIRLEAMEEAGKQEAALLERFLGVVGTIAAISPLLGLLGTVTGMIKIFQKVTSSGVGDPRILAGGIWEALITTAAGLTVAIPAYVAYRYLLSRAEWLILEMEHAATGIMQEIKPDKEPKDRENMD